MSIKNLEERIQKSNNNDDLVIIREHIEKQIKNKGGVKLQELLTKIDEKLKPHLPKTLLDIKTYFL
jgi:hypothetical protein